VWWREIYDMPLELFDAAKSYVEIKMGR